MTKPILHTDKDGCVTCRGLQAQIRRLQTGEVIESDSITEAELALQNEVDRLRAECARLQKMLDVCNVVHEHNMKLKDRTDDLLRRLQHVARLLDVDSEDPREDVLAAALMRLRMRGVERLDVIELRALTRVAHGANYEVWSDGLLVEGGISKDVAIGYAMGLSRAGTLYGGGSYDPIVQVNGFIVWPEERWGDIDE